MILQHSLVVNKSRAKTSDNCFSLAGRGFIILEIWDFGGDILGPSLSSAPGRFHRIPRLATSFATTKGQVNHDEDVSNCGSCCPRAAPLLHHPCRADPVHSGTMD